MKSAARVPAKANQPKSGQVSNLSKQNAKTAKNAGQNQKAPQVSAGGTKPSVRQQMAQKTTIPGKKAGVSSAKPPPKNLNSRRSSVQKTEKASSGTPSSSLSSSRSLLQEISDVVDETKASTKSIESLNSAPNRKSPEAKFGKTEKSLPPILKRASGIQRLTRPKSATFADEVPKAAPLSQNRTKSLTSVTESPRKLELLPLATRYSRSSLPKATEKPQMPKLSTNEEGILHKSWPKLNQSDLGEKSGPTFESSHNVTCKLGTPPQLDFEAKMDKSISMSHLVPEKTTMIKTLSTSKLYKSKVGPEKRSIGPKPISMEGSKTTKNEPKAELNESKEQPKIVAVEDNEANQVKVDEKPQKPLQKVAPAAKPQGENTDKTKKTNCFYQVSTFDAQYDTNYLSTAQHNCEFVILRENWQRMDFLAKSNSKNSNHLYGILSSKVCRPSAKIKVTEGPIYTKKRPSPFSRRKKTSLSQPKMSDDEDVPQEEEPQAQEESHEPHRHGTYKVTPPTKHQKEPVFSEGVPSKMPKDVLMKGEGIIRIQSGTNKFASQHGQTGFGVPRDVVDKVKSSNLKELEGDWLAKTKEEVRPQSGTNKYASQRGMTAMGAPRDVLYKPILPHDLEDVPEDKARLSDGIIPLQMGTNKLDSQKGMTGFGTARLTFTKDQPDQVADSQGFIHLQMGTNRFASQAGMTGFGMPRHNLTKYTDTERGEMPNNESVLPRQNIGSSMGAALGACQSGMSGFGSFRNNTIQTMKNQDRASQGMVPFQMGINWGDSQAGKTGFGMPRQVHTEMVDDAREPLPDELARDPNLPMWSSGYSRGANQSGMTAIGMPRDVKGIMIRRLW